MCNSFILILNIKTVRIRDTGKTILKRKVSEKLEAYTGFAKLYDLFMDNIPYEEWSNYIYGLLNEYKVENGLVLDLGCGTGSVTEFLADKGYDMIGIDNSQDMLNIAMEKKEKSNLDILYLNQDMREFELYGTVKAVISICDSLNYIMEYEELVQVFKLVNNYLDPGGVFIFDMTTCKKFEKIGDSVIGENRPEGSFIWENTYYEDEKINEYDLTIFEKLEDEKYIKHSETHYQKVFSIKEIKKALEESGLQFVKAYDGLSRKRPNRNSERIYVIAREVTK